MISTISVPAPFISSGSWYLWFSLADLWIIASLIWTSKIIESQNFHKKPDQCSNGGTLWLIQYESYSPHCWSCIAWKVFVHMSKLHKSKYHMTKHQYKLKLVSLQWPFQEQNIEQEKLWQNSKHIDFLAKFLKVQNQRLLLCFPLSKYLPIFMSWDHRFWFGVGTIRPRLLFYSYWLNFP